VRTWYSQSVKVDYPKQQKQKGEKAMSERDYNKQLAKRQRINATTLIVGVDVGKAFNALGFMNQEGKVLGSRAKLDNSREGYEQFVEMVEGLKARHHFFSSAWNQRAITGESWPILPKIRAMRCVLCGLRP
jgi:hypothetical protein